MSSAWSPETRNAPTAPAPSFWPTPVRTRSPRRPDWRSRWPGRSVTRPRTASTDRCMPPAPPSPGWCAGDFWAGPRTSMRWPRRCLTPVSVVVVPALTGLGAPWWQPDALAGIEGIGPATQPAHVVRSTVEGLAAQVALLARAVAADLGRPLARLRVDGGLTRSRVLMQMQADLLQVPVEVAASPHATAAGVGALARVGAEPGRALDAVVGRTDSPTCYEPTMGAGEAAERLARFERAVARRVDAGAPDLDRERRSLLRRRHHRRRGGRHRHRSAAGPLPAPHGDPRARRRCGHRYVQGQHGDRAHRLRHRARKPGVDLGPAGPPAAHVLRGRGGHRARGDRRRPGGLGRGTGGAARRRALQSTGQRIRTGHSAHARRTATGANRTSDQGPPGPSPSPTSRSSARGARASRSRPRRSVPASNCGSAPPSPT